jgi:hypothetical protein
MSVKPGNLLRTLYTRTSQNAVKAKFVLPHTPGSEDMPHEGT